MSEPYKTSSEDYVFRLNHLMKYRIRKRSQTILFGTMIKIAERTKAEHMSNMDVPKNPEKAVVVEKETS
jgi:hypothetical protein